MPTLDNLTITVDARGRTDKQDTLSTVRLVGHARHRGSSSLPVIHDAASDVAAETARRAVNAICAGGVQTGGVTTHFLVVDDSTEARGNGPVTLVRGESTGIEVMVSRNDAGQAYIGINTEEIRDDLQDEHGHPLMCVMVNDVVLYDQEPDGERTLRIDDDRAIRVVLKALMCAEAAHFSDDENALRDQLLDRIERDIKLPKEA